MILKYDSLLYNLVQAGVNQSLAQLELLERGTGGWWTENENVYCRLQAILINHKDKQSRICDAELQIVIGFPIFSTCSCTESRISTFTVPTVVRLLVIVLIFYFNLIVVELRKK